MFEDNLFTEEEILNMSNGYTGLHPYIYNSSSTPNRPEHFNTFRKSLEEFLNITRVGMSQYSIYLVT